MGLWAALKSFKNEKDKKKKDKNKKDKKKLKRDFKDFHNRKIKYEDPRWQEDLPKSFPYLTHDNRNELYPKYGKPNELLLDSGENPVPLDPRPALLDLGENPLDSDSDDASTLCGEGVEGN